MGTVSAPVPDVSSMSWPVETETQLAEGLLLPQMCSCGTCVNIVENILPVFAMYYKLQLWVLAIRKTESLPQHTIPYFEYIPLLQH
jgi:hypothetical protein